MQVVDDLGRAGALERVGAQRVADLAHRRGGLHPAPADVADHDPDAAVGELEGVVPVAAGVVARVAGHVAHDQLVAGQLGQRRPAAARAAASLRSRARARTAGRGRARARHGGRAPRPARARASSTGARTPPTRRSSRRACARARSAGRPSPSSSAARARAGSAPRRARRPPAARCRSRGRARSGRCGSRRARRSASPGRAGSAPAARAPSGPCRGRRGRPRPASAASPARAAPRTSRRAAGRQPRDLLERLDRIHRGGEHLAGGVEERARLLARRRSVTSLSRPVMRSIGRRVRGRRGRGVQPALTTVGQDDAQVELVRRAVLRARPRRACASARGPRDGRCGRGSR